MGRTCITISDGLKTELERIRDRDEGVPTLDAAIRHLMTYPREGTRSVEGDDAVLTETVEVQTSTRKLLRYTRDTEDFKDYDDVLRSYAGIEERTVEGEEPIELTPL